MEIVNGPSPQEEDPTPDVFASFYLLELRNFENHLWKYNLVSQEESYLGTLDCPFSENLDYLTAMSSDPKGILWGLSEEYEIFQISPASLHCTSTGLTGANDEFRGESLAFVSEETETSFYLAGYYITPQAFDSTALAQLQQGSLDILIPINNDQGQDTVIDIASTPNQRLFGLRGWGSATELLTFNAEGEITQSTEIFVSTGEAFALVVDNQKKWFFVATSHNSSALYFYEDSSYHHVRDFSFVVVGAAGLE